MSPRLVASRLPLLSLLIAVTCLSQFYRVSNSVIAPELTRDLDLLERAHEEARVRVDAGTLSLEQQAYVRSVWQRQFGLITVG